MAACTFTNSLGKLRLERIRKLFANGPQTTSSVAKALVMSVQHARVCVKELHNRKEIYRCGIIEGDSVFSKSPQYALGPGKDVPIPKTKTIRQYHQRYYKKLKADPERYMRHLAKHRAGHHNKKPHRDETVSAIFGEK